MSGHCTVGLVGYLLHKASYSIMQYPSLLVYWIWSLQHTLYPSGHSSTIHILYLWSGVVLPQHLIIFQMVDIIVIIVLINWKPCLFINVQHVLHYQSYMHCYNKSFSIKGGHATKILLAWKCHSYNTSKTFGYVNRSITQV